MRKIVWTGIASAIAFSYSYLMLFSISGIPLFRTGDEDFFWTYGWRMLNGQVFLRDFHQFTPPGTDLVYETSVITLNPAIGYQFKTGQRDWPKT